MDLAVAVVAAHLSTGRQSLELAQLLRRLAVLPRNFSCEYIAEIAFKHVVALAQHVPAAGLHLRLAVGDTGGSVS